ncbi:Protein of unknown function DUF2269, transmembrane [Thiorhodococcus drewsii AZ1]|uniref:Integral membrane protein n=1 Tax=Thiorhodococcus drewsii AZ1 TaxID=765913 RepID=G2E1Y8_9GAMM|nr:DUF2269 family protein [Thiorhodococcus drewsii]EGV30937.1 Protein of unknown function DUF2269, transmembrane [Thiorhodococcus drewsii AZ1]
MLYALLKSLHVFGVIMLLGNAIVTMIWKMAADRTDDPRLVAFGQRLVTLTDWWFTVGGAAFLMVGGYGAAAVGGLDLFGSTWLVWGQAMLFLSGGLWLGILVPAQIRQARQARVFAVDGDIPATYKRDALRWVVWGIIASVPLIIAIWMMNAKPV